MAKRGKKITETLVNQLSEPVVTPKIEEEQSVEEKDVIIEEKKEEEGGKKPVVVEKKKQQGAPKKKETPKSTPVNNKSTIDSETAGINYNLGWIL